MNVPVLLFSLSLAAAHGGAFGISPARLAARYGQGDAGQRGA